MTDNQRAEEEGTGLPVVKNWRDVYGYVFVAFVVMVVLLAIFTWTFTG